MKTTAFLPAFAAAGLVAAASNEATRTPRQRPHRTRDVPAISISGNAFWRDGERFYIRGIDYQPGGSSANFDPLAEPEVCKRDIKLFEELGVNAIRVYSLENNKTTEHDECMDALADAGIYLMADVNSPEYSINRDDPHPSYNAAYLQSVFATVEEFAKYDNTMLFFSGNEVINNRNNTNTAPYIKAVTRDIKNYIRSRGLREIPVGYSAAEVTENMMPSAEYFNCGSDDARSDFFAFNDYSWCNTDFVTAGWGRKVKDFEDYGLPVFLSEFGCIDNGKRKFGEVESLMHSNTTSIYSGGMMYEYTYELENKFGIVEVAGGGGTFGDVEKLQPEFDNLVSAFSRWPAPTGDGSPAHSTTHSVSCPTEGTDWAVEGNSIPVMPREAEKYMDDGAGDGPGLRGGGSQQETDSGTSSESASSGAPSPSGEGSSSGNSDNSEDGEEDAAGSVVFEKGFLLVTGATVAFTIFGTLLL